MQGYVEDSYMIEVYLGKVEPAFQKDLWVPRER